MERLKYAMVASELVLGNCAPVELKESCAVGTSQTQRAENILAAADYIGGSPGNTDGGPYIVEYQKEEFHWNTRHCTRENLRNAQSKAEYHLLNDRTININARALIIHEQRIRQEGAQTSD
jgi:hypothetical protein